jgi:hypothetical protein
MLSASAGLIRLQRARVARRVSPLVEPYQRKKYEDFAWANKGKQHLNWGVLIDNIADRHSRLLAPLFATRRSRSSRLD